MDPLGNKAEEHSAEASSEKPRQRVRCRGPARHAIPTPNRGNDASEASNGDPNLSDRMERVYLREHCLRRLTDWALSCECRWVRREDTRVAGARWHELAGGRGLLRPFRRMDDDIVFVADPGNVFSRRLR